MKGWIAIGLTAGACVVVPGKLASELLRERSTNEVRRPVEILKPVRFGHSPRIDLERFPPSPPIAIGGGAEVEIHLPETLRRLETVATERDPLASEGSVERMPSPDLSFRGFDSDDNEDLLGVRWRPSDANGDVGRLYYVQWSNKGFKVFHKEDGRLAAGPIAGNVIWTGFGGPCETANGGDPVVLYDHLAQRWLLSQFTAAAYPDGHQCIAITVGPDPLGPYILYDYLFPASLNDYPKLGLWADQAAPAGSLWGEQSAYVMSANMYRIPLGLGGFVGARLLAIDRDAMLAAEEDAAVIDFGGLPCAAECYFSLQPAHLEGPSLPPSGTCPLFVQAFDDDVWGTGLGEDAYQFWEACLDWRVPSNSVLQFGPRLAAPEFDAELCGSRPCVSQPSTDVELAPLSEFTMNRFGVRVIERAGPPAGLQGVLTHTVDVGGDRAGIRWVRFSLAGSSAISIADTGTLGPSDGLHRWVPAIGIDSLGNLGVIYSRSGASSFPSVYFSGRQVGDEPGILRQESMCVEGSGVQTVEDGRWGDYASVSIDPDDGCTFWMTNQYVETSGPFDWDTRVCTFRFPSCIEHLFSDFFDSGELSAWSSVRP